LRPHDAAPFGRSGGIRFALPPYALGITASMPEIDIALRATFDTVFAEPAACLQ
jgi:hypothetical protein